MKKLIFIACLVLGGCAQNRNLYMSQVMKECKQSSEHLAFRDFVACVKKTYAAEGRYPETHQVSSFYVQLDDIAQHSRSKSQAMTEAYRAYDRTIGHIR